ncbi:hypothetical protein V6N13_066780 [Hibiscus sabdariffa]|uniref:Uncharacterized protein n=2 Tax=Hibiscus sabdariffa TaxID=183260 RepID=A0ABR2DRG9_9ROSI
MREKLSLMYKTLIQMHERHQEDLKKTITEITIKVMPVAVTELALLLTEVITVAVTTTEITTKVMTMAVTEKVVMVGTTTVTTMVGCIVQALQDHH